MRDSFAKADEAGILARARTEMIEMRKDLQLKIDEFEVDEKSTVHQTGESINPGIASGETSIPDSPLTDLDSLTMEFKPKLQSIDELHAALVEVNGRVVHNTIQKLSLANFAEEARRSKHASFVGIDRFARAYYFIQPRDNAEMVGIIVEEGYSEAGGKKGLKMAIGQDEIEKMVASLARNGRHEKALLGNLESRIRKVKAKDGSLNVKAFIEWSAALMAPQQKLENEEESEFIKYFYPLARGNCVKLMIIHMTNPNTPPGSKVIPKTFSLSEAKKVANGCWDEVPKGVIGVRTELVRLWSEGWLMLLTERQLIRLNEIEAYSPCLQWLIEVFQI